MISYEVILFSFCLCKRFLKKSSITNKIRQEVQRYFQEF